MSSPRISSQDRTQLIKLASSLPKGSEVRRAVLAGLTKIGIEFSSPEALAKYLKEHPDADKSKHSVKKKEDLDKHKEKDKKEHADQGDAIKKDIEHHSKKLEEIKKDPSKAKTVEHVRDGWGGGQDVEIDHEKTHTDSLNKHKEKLKKHEELGEEGHHKKKNEIRDDLAKNDHDRQHGTGAWADRERYY